MQWGQSVVEVALVTHFPIPPIYPYLPFAPVTLQCQNPELHRCYSVFKRQAVYQTLHMYTDIYMIQVYTWCHTWKFIYFHVSWNIALKKTSLIKQNHPCLLSSSSFHHQVTQLQLETRPIPRLLGIGLWRWFCFNCLLFLYTNSTF